MKGEAKGETITAYKGFNLDLSCAPERGERVQYAIVWYTLSEGKPVEVQS